MSLVYFSRLGEITQESPAFRHGEWSREETGITEVDWGPVVWIREVDLLMNGEPARFIEHYFVARMKGTEIDLTHFTAEEKQAYIAHHWWSLDELRETKEMIFPKNLLNY
ncbi:hypothetical protein [Lihuaxuella thermophila]|uniref:hypothetical protein n=1 Tax=Lihuaxuella thermophila TaxID=1173111 RepID=UPI000B7EE160|nr:hypothetical protein [Lihuaxuella thermophila]